MAARSEEVKAGDNSGARLQQPTCLPRFPQLISSLVARNFSSYLILSFSHISVSSGTRHQLPVSVSPGQLLGYKLDDMPKSEVAADDTLALPVYPELANEQLQHVGSHYAAFFDAET